jgi:glycosyltransferase 2 family protein
MTTTTASARTVEDVTRMLRRILHRLPRRTVRTAGGAAVLGAVLWWTGTGPFVEGLRSLGLGDLVLGAALAVPATVACAWRWRLVARGLGAGLELGPAVAWCYRSQFLNSTLPGGVVGDVHRGVAHGRGAGDTGRGLRAVWWERLAGQVVQAVVVVAVLVLLPSPWRPSVPVVLSVLAVAGSAVVVVRRWGPAAPRWRVPAAVRADVRSALLGRTTWPGVVVASTVALACHVATYLVAARAVGVSLPVDRLLPVALLVLLVAGVPLNVAGWGPREGAAGWLFGAAGFGVELGVATAVAYGAMVLVGSLPGAAVLAAGRRAGHG